MVPPKFAHLESDRAVAHDYGDIYFERPCGPTTQLVIGPSRGQVELLAELSRTFAGRPWFVLYVLLVPRVGNRAAGRYQSPPFDTHDDLAAFLGSFRAFFEGDGRHHVWVGCAGNDGTLVYDQHDVIFAYGALDQFRGILDARRFREQKFWFPSPHTHAYVPQFDQDEERLMAALEWQYFPLQPGDEWG